ncbi:MAG: flagellar biosynthetic protein FliO [Alphaproteobacteria bacterium]|nr:flagellar biosynthetic protein FliO [Alphaproteobacteria bacterium]
MATGVLVIVLGGAVWLMRRMRPGAGWAGGGDCVVLRSLSLGPRERLVVVGVGTRHLVLGVASSSVTLLCELDGPLAPAGSSDPAFGLAVRQAVDRWRGR